MQMKPSEGKFIIYVIVSLLFIRVIITGAAVISITPLSDSAYAQQDFKKTDSDKDKVRSLDYELLRSFEKRREELDRYEEELNKKEERLSILREALEDRLAQFEKIKTELEELVKIRRDLSEKSLKHLVKVYESMKPENAAPLIERLDRDITVLILSRMKGKSAGKILSKVRPTIATKISEQIAKKK